MSHRAPRPGGGSHASPRVAAPLACLALCLAACAGRTSPDEALDPAVAEADRAKAVDELFGPGAAPDQVVARLGDEPITAADLAVYLRMFPTLTTEQAVEDLVDIRAAAHIDATVPESDIRDARIRARAMAWVRRHFWEDPAVSVPDPERVREFVTETRHVTTFGSPELAVVTHVLFTAEGEEEQTPLRARNAEILAARIHAGLRDLGRPVYGFDLLRVAKEVIPEDDPLLDGMELYSDDTLTFPYEYSGSRRWVGLDSVVPGFADASFESEPNQVVGPVQSHYGWHVLVVEERIPPDLPDQATIVALAEERTRREQRSRLLHIRIGELLRSVPVAAYEDNIGLLALSPEERLRQEAAAHGERFR